MRLSSHSAPHRVVFVGASLLSLTISAGVGCTAATTPIATNPSTATSSSPATVGGRFPIDQSPNTAPRGSAPTSLPALSPNNTVSRPNRGLTERVGSENEPPALELISQCYADCPTADAWAAPLVAIYPSGRVVGTRYADGTASSAEYVEGSIDVPQVQALLSQARAAGVEGGQRFVVGTAQGSTGGSASVFVARNSGVATSVAAPFLTVADPPAGSDEPQAQRDKLRDLRRALVAVLDDAAMQPVRPDAWGIQPIPSPQPSTPSAPPEQRPNWATAIAFLPADTTLLDGLLCTMLVGQPVIDNHDTLRRAATESSAFTFEGEAWTVAARPMLPHERSCAAVAAHASQVGLAELDRLAHAAPGDGGTDAGASPTSFSRTP